MRPPIHRHATRLAGKAHCVVYSWMDLALRRHGVRSVRIETVLAWDEREVRFQRRNLA